MTNSDAAVWLEVLATDHSERVADALRLGAAALRDSEWLPIEGAPKGCVTEDVGCRGESEWFLGLLKSGDARKVLRLPDSFNHMWSDHDETYYTADWLVGWRPLPQPPKEQG